MGIKNITKTSIKDKNHKRNLFGPTMKKSAIIKEKNVIYSRFYMFIITSNLLLYITYNLVEFSYYKFPMHYHCTKCVNLHVGHNIFINHFPERHNSSRHMRIIN